MTEQEPTNKVAAQVLEAARMLRDAADALKLNDTAAWIYNPLQYAWQAHEQYVTRYAKASCEVLLLGMNPGPWGMAQTGVPFGEVRAVVEWLGIDAPIDRPAREHPKRPVEGLRCKRSEVSGQRLWGLFRERFGAPQSFFKKHFVANYCPLVFMEESARNLTPDKLPATARAAIEQIGDAHLAALVRALEVKWLIGVGAFAEACARRVVADHAFGNIQIGRILHPSPASPAANKDWSGTATQQLIQLGVWGK